MSLLPIEREVNVLGFLLEGLGMTGVNNHEEIPAALYAIAVTVVEGKRSIKDKEGVSAAAYAEELFNTGVQLDWRCVRDKNKDGNRVTEDLRECIRFLSVAATVKREAAAIFKKLCSKKELEGLIRSALANREGESDACGDCGGGCACEDNEKTTKVAKTIVSSRIPKDKWPECPF